MTSPTEPRKAPPEMAQSKTPSSERPPLDTAFTAVIVPFRYREAVEDTRTLIIAIVGGVVIISIVEFLCVSLPTFSDNNPVLFVLLNTSKYL